MGIKCRECKKVYPMEEAHLFAYREKDGTLGYHDKCKSCREGGLKCRRCGDVHPRDEAEKYFYRRSDRPSGFQRECKRCRDEINKKYRKTKSKKKVQNSGEKAKRDKFYREKEQGREQRKRERDRLRHKKYDANRDRLAEDRVRLLARCVEKIGAKESVGETPRTLNFNLRAIMEQQLGLFYGKKIHSMTGIRRKKTILEETLFEIKEALTRCSTRMKVVCNSEPDPADDDILLSDHAERHEALAILGLPVTASQKQIKHRYRELAKKHHSDHAGNDEKMKEINAAWSTLEEK